MFFLDVGRGSQAEAAVREAVEIHERVLAGGQLKGSVERYAARNFANLGRILVATGQTREAEQSYRKAVDLLDRLVEELPESAYPRVTWRGRCPIWRICSRTLAAGKRPSISAVA